jgi:hypothetical protein
LVGYASQKARHGTFLQSASTATLQAAVPAVCFNRRMWIPLARCNADHDSGRGTGKRGFIRKMRPFEESPTLASHKYAVVEHLYGVPPPFGWGLFTVTEIFRITSENRIR